MSASGAAQKDDRSSGFVGRRAELRTLRAALEAAEGGRGRVVLVGGEPGIGKTRLVEEAVAAAPRRRVLWGRCRNGEGAPAYWPWRQALRAWADDASDGALVAGLGDRARHLLTLLPSLRARLADAPPDDADAREQNRFQLFDAVAGALQHIAADELLVVVLDDLQWADSESLQLLGFVGAEIRRMRVLLVGTYRDVEMRQATVVTRALGDLARVSDSILLAGLPLEDVATFVHAGGADVPDEAIGDVRAATGGNPFFLKEVVALVRRRGWTAGGRVPLPHEVREVVRLRLDPLTPDARRLLDVAAVLGREFDLTPLTRVAELEPETALAAVAEAIDLGLVAPAEGVPGRHRFAHALVESTLYDDLPAGERAALHQRVGETLEALHGADTAPIASELAYHFLRAATDEARAKAARHAIRAGDQSRAALAWEDAAGHYERALHAHGPAADPRERLQVLFAYGQMQAYAGDVDGFRATFLEAARLARDLDDAPGFARAALAYAYLRKGTGAVDRTMNDLLDEARRRLGTADPLLRSRVLGRLAAASYHTIPLAERDAMSKESVAIAREIDDPLTLAMALLNRHNLLQGPGELAERVAVTREAVRAAEAAGDEDVLCDVRVAALVDLLEAGDADGVERELALAVRAAEALRIPRLRWRATMARAMMAHLTGRIVEAEGLSERAFAISRGAAFSGDATSYHAALMVQVRHAQGRLGELVTGIATAAGRPGAMPIHRHTLAFAQVELGQLDAARATFAAAATRDFSDVPNDWSRLPSLALLAETCAALGDERAAALLQPLLERYAAHMVVLGNPSVCLGPTTRYLGLLAATRGQLADAIALLESAIATATRLGAVPARCRAEADLARVLVRRNAPGDHARAAALVVAARDALRALDLPFLASRVGDVAVEDAAPHVGGATARVVTIGRTGSVWELRSGDESAQLRHVKGLDYLVALLRRPGIERHVLDLAGTAPSGAGADLARARLQELREALEEAQANNDLGRVDMLRSQMEELAESVAASLGARTGGATSEPEVERARLNVGRALHAVVRRVASECPILGRHLTSAVRTGVVCAYQPDPTFPVRWELPPPSPHEPRFR